MNFHTPITALAAVSLTLTISSCSQEKSTESDQQVTTEDAALFNGTDLAGWKIVGGNGQYKVEDGHIVGFGKEINDNTFLRTEKTFTDFELTFDFKFDNLDGNSGVMFRANQKPSDDGNGRVFGYQCEADNTERAWSAGIYDEARRKWLFPNKESEEHAELRKEFTKLGNQHFNFQGWNTFKVRCEGNHIQTWLNGEKRVDYTDTDEVHDTREGFIALQVHKGPSFQARWKNIILKELK